MAESDFEFLAMSEEAEAQAMAEGRVDVQCDLRGADGTAGRRGRGRDLEARAGPPAGRAACRAAVRTGAADRDRETGIRLVTAYLRGLRQ